VWLAAVADPGATTGKLFLDRRPRPFDRLPSTRLTQAQHRRLWDVVAELAGVPDALPRG